MRELRLILQVDERYLNIEDRENKFMENLSKKNSRRDAAATFLKLTASGNVREAYSTYVASNFRHHNPYFPGDPESLAKGMAENARRYPNMIFEVQRVLEDGDLVAVHSRVRMNPDSTEMALVHICRFEGDRIAEMWDIGQQVPDNSPNKSGMF